MPSQSQNGVYLFRDILQASYGWIAIGAVSDRVDQKHLAAFCKHAVYAGIREAVSRSDDSDRFRKDEAAQTRVHNHLFANQLVSGSLRVRDQ
jgi:hypothetical protein